MSTPTALAAPPGAISLTAITPGVLFNDRPQGLTLTGANFVAGTVVVVGGRPLQEVEVESSTALTATLPAGVCPGTYPVTVVDPLGREASGGQLVVQALRSATLGDAPPAPPLDLRGHPRTLVRPLPPVHLQDTTCDTGDWRLTFAVSDLTHASGGHPPLVPRVLRVDGPGLPGRVSVAISAADGRGAATLVVPRAAGRSGATLEVWADLEVPVGVRAGAYAGTVSVTLSDAP